MDAVLVTQDLNLPTRQKTCSLHTNGIVQLMQCEAGCILGPFRIPPLLNFRTSELGLVPKHDGGWRVIYHLSALLAIVLSLY